MPGSPAAGADIDWPRARLLAIGDIRAEPHNIAALRELLDAPAGTKLQLTLLLSKQDGKEKPHTTRVELTSEKYPIQTVQGFARDGRGRWVWRIAPPGQVEARSSKRKKTTSPARAKSEKQRQTRNLYYMRLAEFAPSTRSDLLNVLRRLKAPGGFVLDLRSNPGGSLPAGVAVAEIFLAQGDIVTILGRDGKKEVHVAHCDSPYETVPIVALINGQTSSAAELLAGALAANNRAVLVGSQTRGKGCVQTMLTLPGNLGQANLTTAEFFVDPARPIQRRANAKHWGVSPTLKIPITTQQALAIKKWQTKLSLNPPRNASLSATHDAKTPCQVQRRIAQDKQLALAIEILRQPEKYAKYIKLRKTIHEPTTNNNPGHRE
jgi:C-terminal processing protease CtpA/Prc